LLASLLEERGERVEAQVAAPDEPFVVLLDHDHRRQPDERAVVREDADDVGAAADLAVEPVKRVRGTELARVVGREGVEGEQVLLGLLEQCGDLRQRRPQPFERVPEQRPR